MLEPDDLGPLTHDAIAGSFRITQRRHGHRYSVDDVLTAWEAASVAPGALRCLELGSGIGSVLLMLAYKLPEASFVAVEAQRNSFRLLEQNVRQNELQGRVRLLHGDLREVVTAQLAPFDLVTGTPPYVPPGTATPSSDSQKAYARQELRGGVEDYLAAMGRVLSPAGRGVVCADARFPARVFEGARRAGLSVLRRRDVVPRAGKAALFAVFTLARQQAGEAHSLASGPSGDEPGERAPDWVARDEAGARTCDYLAVREFFGIPSPAGEAPSP
jgi:tRNA1Val (adenine37-N6)-methyltransferase